MSEYQYYEFQTVDRPLSEEERREISSWSSRTTPTLNQAIFTYSYSNFPKSPKKSVSKIVTEDYIILDLFFNDEEGGGNWIEGEGWLSSLIRLRNDILNGDYRMLYLAWLNSLNFEYNIEDYLEKQEPPIPDNLQNLSAPLKSFIEFFEIDKDL